ncbi:MAG TPA: uroporphyrinogen-III synthase, partial [Chloroflexota bacterium]|nr:uroporphyrinogen-III synthase [Chloroflexota bacterium]
MADLGGRVVAFLEARRATELADLIARHRGVPLAAPCLRELHQADAPSLAKAIHELCDLRVGFSIFLTGVGAATIFEAARLHGREAQLREALARQRVAVRGPKPAAELRRLGLRFEVEAPPPHTTLELLAAIDAWPLAGSTVAVQLYGGPNPELIDALRRRGAEVLELSPYAWSPPEAGPVVRLLDELDRGRVDALLVTSQAQVDNLLAIAHDYGRRLALGRVAVGAQGPLVEAALARAGLPIAFRADHGHMGALVLAAARH